MKLALGCATAAVLASLGLAGAARAQTSPAPSAAPLVNPDDATNRVGRFQLMLDAPPLTVDLGQGGGLLVGTAEQGHGFGVTHSFVPSASQGYVGLGAGVGYTLTALLEVGGALGLSYYGGTSTFELMAEPFLKLNFGPALKLGTINPFLTTGFGMGVIAPPGTSFGVFAFDINPGVEWLFGGRWGAQVFVPIQIEAPTTSGADVGFNIGVGYGLVGYL